MNPLKICSVTHFSCRHTVGFNLLLTICDGPQHHSDWTFIIDQITPAGQETIISIEKRNPNVTDIQACHQWWKREWSNGFASEMDPTEASAYFKVRLHWIISFMCEMIKVSPHNTRCDVIVMRRMWNVEPQLTGLTFRSKALWITTDIGEYQQ